MQLLFEDIYSYIYCILHKYLGRIICCCNTIIYQHKLIKKRWISYSKLLCGIIVKPRRRQLVLLLLVLVLYHQCRLFNSTLTSAFLVPTEIPYNQLKDAFNNLETGILALRKLAYQEFERLKLKGIRYDHWGSTTDDGYGECTR